MNPQAQPVRLYGLSQRQAAWLIERGWPDGTHLREISAALREWQCYVEHIAPGAVYCRDTSGIAWGAYATTPVAELRRQLDLSGDPRATLAGRFAGLDVSSSLTETVSIWTDGSGNRADGHAGIGCVIDWPGQERVEVSEYIGLGTNNHAELSAIWRGLQGVLCLDTPIRVYTDSEYCCTVLTRECRMVANVELIRALWVDLKQRRNVVFEHVKGHSGIELNERADKLAGAGRRKGMPPQPVKVRRPRRTKGATP